MFLYRNICPLRGNAMNALVPKNADHVIGVLSGWDRLVFRGTLRMLADAGGMAAYFSRMGTLLKDFGDHAQAMTDQLIQASLKRAESGGTPRPLPSFAQRSQGRLCPADRPRRRRCRRTYLRPDVRRAVSVVRDLPQPRKENPRNRREEPQMQSPSTITGSTVRWASCPCAVQPGFPSLSKCA